MYDLKICGCLFGRGVDQFDNISNFLFLNEKFIYKHNQTKQKLRIEYNTLVKCVLLPLAALVRR